MPNYMQRKGQETPRERPEMVKPVPDTVEGVFYPYRGNQNHGVAQPPNVDVDDYYEQEAWDTDEEGETLPAEPEPDPIPVRIVQRTARERLEWRALRVAVNEHGTWVVNRHEKRRKMVIRLPSLSSAVYIASEESRTFSAYQMEQATEVELFTTEGVWAITAAGETSELHIYYEYAVEL